MTLSCTCGPHPVVKIDLDSLNNSGSSSAVHDACSSHGCFHLRISVPHDDPSPLHNLRGDLCSNIESLFDENMVRCAKLNPDGGLIETSYVTATSRRSATYRGRTSESGAAEQPEPKQSWELKRCHAVVGSDVAGESNIVDERLQQASGWTDGLHQAAEIVVQMLGVDQNTILQNGPCGCSDMPCESKCCMDLMRVFRYDALPSDQSRTSCPGSSPHSDWGCLTVVFQDTSGGLQTYCHECDKWSDVAASLDAGASKNTIDLFVHIGDFLSLATGGNYLSPRHRVLCPLQKEEGSYKESRCSLVYFAYPPPGKSIEEAEIKLSANNNTLEKRGASLRYDRYSLLQNQSTQPSDKSAHKDVYDRIRTLSFDEAIKEKWAQVQRK